jgi:hypothetical protein
MKRVLIILAIIAVIILVMWLGFQVKPQHFKALAQPQPEMETMEIPQGLPKPVENFYRSVYGEKASIINSVVIIGHGRVRQFGIWLPTRFAMIHNAGKDYRHYFEATFFGIPVLKINEGYIDGQSFFESPMGTYYNDANSNQGANLALWAEGAWFPSLWISDARAHWQAIDDTTAALFVPYEKGEENFIVRFNPQSGLVDLMEVMRYRSPGDTDKVLWLTNEVKSTDGSAVSYATWLDDGKPWAEFVIDDVRFNLDVSDLIRARGWQE